jgi:hypothetical protein
MLLLLELKYLVLHVSGGMELGLGPSVWPERRLSALSMRLCFRKMTNLNSLVLQEGVHRVRA